MYSGNLYETYFRGLAEKLADLGHTEAKPRFWVNHELGSLSELNAALRSNLRVPALVLEVEELDTDGSGTGQKVSLVGGFTVLDKVQSANALSVRDVRHKTKTIARKLVNRMKRDSRAMYNEESTLLLANAIQLGNIKQYPAPLILNEFTGWCVEFEWLVPDDISFGMGDFA
ncbi:hypothetical protein GCM10027275_24860 [Rhabdobacter roseus]|uniref:Uncharacterized protein n=1 Tax=Rhabdobacter roseus TaxID=1655419 RepID=A0A840TJP8_9BACT|nr:hypothetical protein [Rhabdobacter roseus]MBB5284426.1 hypothetical protein [Rhabdobacter roseus]